MEVNDSLIIKIAEDSAATRQLLETHLASHHDESLYVSIASAVIAFAAFFANVFRGS